MSEAKEPLSDELCRLVLDYQNRHASDPANAEAWNLLADFAYSNAPMLIGLLRMEEQKL